MEGIHDSNYARKHEGFIRDPEPYYQHKGGHAHCGKTEFFVFFCVWIWIMSRKLPFHDIFPKIPCLYKIEFSDKESRFAAVCIISSLQKRGLLLTSEKIMSTKGLFVVAALIFSLLLQILLLRDATRKSWGCVHFTARMSISVCLAHMMTVSHQTSKPKRQWPPNMVFDIWKDDLFLSGLSECDARARRHFISFMGAQGQII